jgi:hypothetical protein
VSVEDDECSRRPGTSKMIENVGKILELIHKDHHQTIQSSQTLLGSVMEFAKRSQQKT